MSNILLAISIPPMSCADIAIIGGNGVKTTPPFRFPRILFRFHRGLSNFGQESGGLALCSKSTTGQKRYTIKSLLNSLLIHQGSFLRTSALRQSPSLSLLWKSGLSQCLDILRINGTDQAGNKAIFLWLASLDPRDVCTFVLTNNSPYAPSGSIQPKALIGVCGFDREPAPVLQKEDQVAFLFTPPENIKVEGICLLMKRVV